MRYRDGWIVIAAVSVEKKHRRQGVFLAFLIHCEATGLPLVVEFVVNKHIQQFNAANGDWRAMKAVAPEEVTIVSDRLIFTR